MGRKNMSTHKMMIGATVVYIGMIVMILAVVKPEARQGIYELKTAELIMIGGR